jgi:hypothetical protein
MSSFILSESGYPGFEDLQDIVDKFLVFLCVYSARFLRGIGRNLNIYHQTGNREQGTGNIFNCLDILNFPNPTKKNALILRHH